MRTVLFYIICIVLTFDVYSQDDDVIYTKEKYEFERYFSNGTKRLKSGKSIEVVLNDKDTFHSQSGYLIGVKDSFLILNMDYEYFQLQRKNYSFNESFEYENSKQQVISFESIKYVEYEPNASFVFGALGGVSLFTALFIAPLVSIDKKWPNNFNSKRYVTVLGSALIGAVVGTTVFVCIGTDKRVKPKKMF